MRSLLVWAFVACSTSSAARAAEPRARDLGVPFEHGQPGPLNAITDVRGVEVGHETLVQGGSVRTGVTAILPRGKGEPARQPCFSGFFSLNGNGEMTGVHWLAESGLLEGPILLTNTNAVGVVRDAVISYAARRWPPRGGDWTVWSLPVVAETWDGGLNDIYGMHVKPEHALAAIERAAGGSVAEGSVGGGTGMVCFELKGGIGTASRVLTAEEGGHTLGVLVQANFGRRRQLRIAGLPVGLELADVAQRRAKPAGGRDGSIIVVVATDAPLLPHQLERLARRAALGLARTGGVAGDSSGDLMLAFSTANAQQGGARARVAVEMLPNEVMDPLFEATAAATEEAILNALVAARDMTGHDGQTVRALPQARVREILRRHGRLAAGP